MEVNERRGEEEVNKINGGYLKMCYETNLRIYFSDYIMQMPNARKKKTTKHNVNHASCVQVHVIDLAYHILLSLKQ